MQSQSHPTIHSDDEEAIRALEDRFIAAFNTGNIDAIMKNYLPGKELVILDLVPREKHLGADTYRENWKEMFSRFKGEPKLAISGLGITVEGSIGFGHCFMRMTGIDIQGNPVDRKVRVTNGYRKVDGKWLIALEHISMPIDLKTGKAVQG